MTASRSTDAVPQTIALAGLTAARTAKGSDTDHASFGDELTEAQRPAGSSSIAVSRQHADQQHRGSQQRPGRQAPERDVPRHPVLRGRSGGGATTTRTTTPVAHKPVVLHPLTATDPTTAAALSTTVPPQTVPIVPAKATPATPAARATAAPAATTAPTAPAAAAPPAPATTALVAGSPSASVAPDRQQPVADAATKVSPADASSAAPVPGSPAASAQQPASQPAPVQITVTTPGSAPTLNPATVPAPTVQAQPQQSPAQLDPSAVPAPVQVAASATTAAQPAGQHHVAPLPGQPDPAQPGGQPTVTVSASTDRETTDQGPAQQQGHDPAPAAHAHAGSLDAASVGVPATAYSLAADQTQPASSATTGPALPGEARSAQEVPATQALPPGTLAQVNSAEHSVRVQVETESLGKVTAEMHTRPGEIGVHLSVPDDAGRALMAQRLDALRDSLGQGGSAVHLSLAAQGDFSPGQQSGTPREDRAQAQSDHRPHDAATPRATDGSPMTTAPADGTRLVDVHA